MQLGDPVLRPSTPQRALGWGPAAAPRHVVSFHLPLTSKGLELNHQPSAGPSALCTRDQGLEQHPWGSPCSTSLGAIQGPPCLALDTKRGALWVCPRVHPRPLRGREPVHLRRPRGPKPRFRVACAFTSESSTHRPSRVPIPVGRPRVPAGPRTGARRVLHRAGQQGSPRRPRAQGAAPHPLHKGVSRAMPPASPPNQPVRVRAKVESTSEK